MDNSYIAVFVLYSFLFMLALVLLETKYMHSVNEASYIYYQRFKKHEVLNKIAFAIMSANMCLLSFSAESIVLKVALFTCGIFSVCTVYVARKKWLVDYVKSLAALSGDKKLKLESAWKKKLNVSLLVKAVRFATFLAGLVSTYYVMMYIYENYPS